MSKCDLRIELEKPGETLLTGEEVKGTLVVEVNDQCQCDALTVTRLWRTHGKGNRASGGEETLTLFEGRLLPGETLQYPFTFEVPAGPVTYHGHYLNVDWYLEARADVPWAIDPKAEAELLVAPGPAGVSPGSEASAGLDLNDPRMRKLPAILGGVVACFFVLPGLGMIVGGAIAAAYGNTELLILVLMGAMFTVVGSIVCFMALRSTLAERKLGPVELSVDPQRCRPGDTVEVSLRFQPRSQGQLNGITATFQGKESVTRGSGSHRHTFNHDLFSQTEELAGAQDLYSGDSVELKSTFRVPEDAAYSFHARDNSLSWSVQVHIDIAGWPDWHGPVSLLVGA